MPYTFQFFYEKDRTFPDTYEFYHKDNRVLTYRYAPQTNLLIYFSSYKTVGAVISNDVKSIEEVKELIHNHYKKSL